MSRNHRNSQKRFKYNCYAMESKRLAEDLKNGTITQEEYDFHHELIDSKYADVR